LTSTARFDNWQNRLGTQAGSIDASGNVTFDNDVTVTGSLSLGSAAVGEWQDWTANFRSETGTYTSADTIYARYSLVNNLVVGSAYFRILTRGTGTGSAEFDLPVTAAARYTNGHNIGVGRENQINGHMMNVFVFNSNEGHIRFYDNGDPSANDYFFIVTFAYEAA
jgi:hypothetical protein